MIPHELETEIFKENSDKEDLARKISTIALASNNRLTTLQAGVILKEAGFFVDASEVFKDWIERNNFDDHIVYELIQVYRRSGKDQEGDDVLFSALTQTCQHDYLIKELVFRTCIDPNTGPAHRQRLLPELIKRLQFNTSVNPTSSTYSSAFVHFGISFRARVEEVREFYKRTSFRNPAYIHAAIHKALVTRVPFALVRFGDGEGAFLSGHRSTNEERELHSKHQLYFLNRWYGDITLMENEEFQGYCAYLMSRVRDIDVIGLPEQSWLDHESSLRNVATTCNCIRAVTAVADYAQKSCATNTSIHIDLEYRSLISSLIKEANRVVFVTSHSALASRVRSSLKLADDVELDTILIPPAASDLSHTGYSIASSHFHSDYKRVVASIQECIRPGVLVLVSAGFLGKGYCIQAKDAGGVALDIGSVSDLWMGFETRPNFRGLQRLQLVVN